VTDMLSFKEQLEHECRMTRLELWCLRQWLRRHPEESAAYVLRNRTNIYLRSSFYDGRRFKLIDWTNPSWLEAEEALSRLIEQSDAQDDTTDFEEGGLALFRSTIAQRLRRNRRRPKRRRFLPGAEVCGSLWFTPPDAGPQSNRLFFHITNAVRPHSIFAAPEYLPRCLESLMDKAQRLGCDRLWTLSWLNSYPRWQALFPDTWRQDMGDEKTAPEAGMQFWGQFVNARGTFNAKHAEQFRRTGRVPYAVREAGCTFESLRAHLRALRDS